MENEENEVLDENLENEAAETENEKTTKQEDVVPKSEYDELDDRNLKIIKKEVVKKDKHFIIQF